MVGRERLGVVGRVLLMEPGLRKTEGMEMRMTELSGNKISKRISSQKNSEKGFTLVELLVVLVILAIIAAVAVPAMLGFTDDAREKQYITEAKEALTATQAMISDVYTDNLVYISKSMRDKALETSGLNGDSTEFVVWTEKSFKSADGTFDTYKSYAIASALYVVNGNTFVFYNNGKWEVSDSFSIIGNKAKAGASYSRGAAIYAEDSNYITIWPSDSESANKDTAINKKYADNSDELIDDDENKRHDDSQNYDINKPSKDKPGVTVYISAPKAINNYVPLTVSGGENYSVALTNSGFKNDVVLSNIDNIHYNGGSLKWRVQGQDFENLDYVEQFLMSTYEDADSIKESISVYVKGYIDERKVSVKVGFEALDPNTQTVSIGDGDDSFVEVDYRMANEDIDSAKSFEYTDIHVVSKDPLIIKHDGNWAEKGINGQYIKNGANYILANTSEIKSEVAVLTKAYVNNNVGNDESSIAAAETELKTNGFTFVAPADIYKKVHVRGLLNDEKTGFLGEVKFGSEKADMFAETFVCNELTKKVYKANGADDSLSKGIEVADSVGNVVNHYSIFTGHEIYIGEEKYTPDNIYKKAKKVKFWNLYDSEFSYDITDELNGSPEKNREQYNCTKEIIEKLYKDSNSSFGEVAEVDMSDLTTKLYNEESGVTPLKGIFETLAGGNAANIHKIEYVDGVEAPAPSSVYREVGISWTTVKSESEYKLERKNGKYVADVIRDPNYPAYTVAYSQSIGGGKYDIFVITEDRTDIKVEGTLQQMNSKFSSMVSNDVIGKFETSGVTDMSSMFNECKVVESIDLSEINTSNVTDFSYMFNACSKITTLDTSSFTSNEGLTSVEYMFNGCEKLNGLDLRGFSNCPNLETMGYWFANCKNIDYIDLKNFEPGEALTTITFAFYYVGCTNTGFNTSNRSSNHGCMVFAKNWNVPNVVLFDDKNGTDDKANNVFEYFRPNLYGTVYKNSNAVYYNQSRDVVRSGMSNASDPDNYVYLKKSGTCHFMVHPTDMCLSIDKFSDNKTDYAVIHNTSGIRAVTGYFNDTNTDFYSNWANEKYGSDN